MENKKHEYVGRKVLVRCNHAGVFYGTLAELDRASRVAKLTDCRRIHYWSGAASLSQMAMEGVKRPNDCRFTMAVPEITVCEVIEMLPCAKVAVENIEAVKVWKM